MATPLPVLLETSTTQKGDGGAKLPDAAGTQIAVDLYSCSGLTPAYTRSRVARLGAVSERGADWAHHFFGGAGPGTIEVEGGAPDLDTAVKDQWEVEVIKGSSVWYRGRVVDYRHREDRTTGRIYTTLYAEGYVTRLRNVLVTKTYTSGTVAAAVQDILDTYVTPSTRMDYTAADIQGGYTINGIKFIKTPLLDAMNTLAMLQGDVEWGVSEGDPKPKFYFLAESTSAKEEMQAISGQRATLDTEGVFGEAYNTIKVLGGWGTTIVTGTATDATAAAAYGTIEKAIPNSAITHATDANRYATNWLALYKDGTARYRGEIQSPPSRLEKDRTAGTPFAATGYASFRGVDGVMARMPMSSVEYRYRKGSPFAFAAVVHGGLPENCVQQQHAALAARVSSLEGIIQQYDTSAVGGAHTILSATHTDTAAAALVRGDLLVAQTAGAVLTRLATGAGNSGKFLQSTTVDTLWSAWTLPASVSAQAFLYAPSANLVGEITTNPSAVMVTDAGGNPAFSQDLPSVTTKGGTAIAGTGANTYTGKQTLDGAPTTDLHAATKLYTDGGGGSVALTDAAPTSLDPTLGKRFTHTAAANRTVNATVGTPDGKLIVYEVKSDSAVARVITFGTNILSTGVLTTPASATLVVSATFVSDGTNYKEISRQVAGI